MDIGLIGDSTSWESKPLSIKDLLEISEEVIKNKPPESTKYYVWLSPKEFKYMLDNDFMDKVVDGGYRLNNKARSEGGIGMIMIPENTLIYESKRIPTVKQVELVNEPTLNRSQRRKL